MTTSISILIVNEGGNNRSAAVLVGIFVLVRPPSFLTSLACALAGWLAGWVAVCSAFVGCAYIHTSSLTPHHLTPHKCLALSLLLLPLPLLLLLLLLLQLINRLMNGTMPGGGLALPGPN
eukprot:COSAG06_NODE_8226_length_2227_cov_33.547842_3_plen_120_part_00